MGSASRQNRCEKFIAEFNEDAVKVFGLEDVVAQGLEYDDVHETVIFTAIINSGSKTHLVKILDAPEFDLEMDDEILIE